MLELVGTKKIWNEEDMERRRYRNSIIFGCRQDGSLVPWTDTPSEVQIAVMAFFYGMFPFALPFQFISTTI